MECNDPNNSVTICMVYFAEKKAMVVFHCSDGSAGESPCGVFNRTFRVAYVLVIFLFHWICSSGIRTFIL